MSVSVITPMYNEALNIEKCYRSLCKQKKIKFEWIVIDDGSTDGCNNIVRNIMAVHSDDFFEIKLIIQENAGAAAARLNGINNCKYDVVTILDSDDQLSEHALECAFIKISESVDIVCYKLHYVNLDGNFISNFNYTPKNWPVEGNAAFSECINGWGLAGCFMIKKELILLSYNYVNEAIKENTINLDELVSRISMFNANQIDLCDEIYFYYQNPLSTTRKRNYNYYKMIYTAIELNNFILSHGNIEQIEKSQMHLLSTLTAVYLRYLKWSNELINKNNWKSAMKEIAKFIYIKRFPKNKGSLNSAIKKYIKFILFLYVSSSLFRVEADD